jgi:hypothetical protein
VRAFTLKVEKEIGRIYTETVGKGKVVLVLN